MNTAADGKAALDGITSRTPDLVMSDIHMPDLDGMSLLAELRVRHQDVPVILIMDIGLPQNGCGRTTFRRVRLFEQALHRG